MTHLDLTLLLSYNQLEVLPKSTFQKGKGKEKMSHVFCPHTMFGALRASERPDFLESGRSWHPVNTLQELFLQYYGSAGRSDQLARLPEMESWVDWSHAVLNRVLEEHGFDIRFKPFGADTFGTLSILKIIALYRIAGERTRVQAQSNRCLYDAVNLSEDAGVVIYHSRNHPYPIAAIPTKNGDTLYLTKAVPGADHLFNFDLMQAVQRVVSDLVPEYKVPNADRHEGVIFPMVKYDEQINIDWMLNLWTVSGPRLGNRKAWIAQAIKQTIFGLNEKGFIVKDATGFVVALECCVEPALPLVIDAPFYVAMVRRGVDLPIMVGYIDEGNWRDPGDLNAL